MSKEYKTLTYDDDFNGRTRMGQDLDNYSRDGWTIKSKETTQQGWALGKTCCLGIIFLPLALLGKKKNILQVILEREVSPKQKEESL